MNPLGSGKGIQQPVMNPMISQIESAIQFARTFASPEEYMRHLQQNNPQMFNRIMDMQRTVQDPVAYANKVLSEWGINPAQIAGMFQTNKMM